MIKFHTAILAMALTTPFGLAIHDDLTREHVDCDATRAAEWNLDSHSEFDRSGPGNAGLEPSEPDQEEPAGISAAALRKLAGAERATLGEALAPLRFGMTADQARQAVPRMDSWAEPADELSQVDVLLEYLGQGDTRLTAVQIEFRGSRQWAAKELNAMWGEPQLRGAGGADIWISEPVATRTVLRSDGEYVTIETSQVMTLEELAGPGENKTGLGKHLLGAGIKDLAASGGIWRDRVWVDPYYGEYAVAQLPGMAMDPGARSTTKVMMTLAGGKVRTVELAFGCGEQCEAASDALQSRLGAAGFAVRTQGQGENATIELKAEPGQ